MLSHQSQQRFSSHCSRRQHENSFCLGSVALTAAVAALSKRAHKKQDKNKHLEQKTQVGWSRPHLVLLNYSSNMINISLTLYIRTPLRSVCVMSSEPEGFA